MSLRAVLYARVSSAQQRERHTIASQLSVLPAYIARQGWELVRPPATYVDDGRSARAGRLEARTGLAELLRDAAAGTFDVVVVVDLDRLTRSEDLAERGAILGAFQRAGVKIASASTGQVLDLSTSLGDLFGSLQAFFAAEESRKRGERSMRGKLEIAARGGKISGLTPFGLAYDKPTRTWSLHPERAPIVREIFERVVAGESCYLLADELNARGVPFHGRNGTWNRGRVYDLVTSRHPAGEYMAHAKTHTLATVPAIVSEELWERAQAALAAARKTPLRKTKHTYLLEGLARCGACGGRLLVISGCPQKRRWMRPSQYICEHRKNRRGAAKCAAPRVRVLDVDARVWAAICRELDDPGLPAALAAERRERAADERDWSRDAEGFREHLRRLDRVAEGLLRSFRRGALTEEELDRELAAVNRERQAVREQLATAERAQGASRSAQARLEEAAATMERLRAKLAGATLQEQREIALAVIGPGGVAILGDHIRVELWIERPAATEAGGGGGPVALVAGQPSTGGYESRLRIRLVA